jgi:hypothetical protein
MPIAEQMRLVDAECEAIGRNPAEIRRSTWTTGEALASADAFRDYAQRQLQLGFTDVSVLLPEKVDEQVLAAVARDVLPDLRGYAMRSSVPEVRI